MKPKRKRTIILALFALLLCLIGTWHLFYQGNSQSQRFIGTDLNAEYWNGEQELQHPRKESKNIAIPGIKSLVFEVNKTKQKVNFCNPVENKCLIQFTLVVGDKELWQSGYCEPGKGYYSIELTEPLQTGVYQAYLRYGCFQPNGDVLNSAKMEFPLYVQ